MTATVTINIAKYHDHYITVRLVNAAGVDVASHKCVPGNIQESCEFTIEEGVTLQVFEGQQGPMNSKQSATVDELQNLLASQAEHARNAAEAALQEIAKRDARIAELESANATAQTRAVKQRSK